MKSLKNIFDFYIHASIHVAIATWALVCLTFHFSHLPFDWILSCFVFFSTIFSYNFIKYYAVIFKIKLTAFLKGVLFINLFSAIISVFLFFRLKETTQLWVLFFGILTFFYAIPIGKLKSNLRNIAGIKIYIVSISWAGVTLLLPLINANELFNEDVWYKFIQRFILTLMLILIFEINDLKYDDIRLKTVPQSIGVLNTKYLIYVLCVPFFVFEFFKIGFYPNQILVNFIIVVTIVLFTFFSDVNRNKYYTLFWVETVPILWLLLSVLYK